MLDYLPMILFFLVVAVPVALVVLCYIGSKNTSAYIAAREFRLVYYRTISTLEVEHEREVLRREKLWALAEVRTLPTLFEPSGFGFLVVEIDKKRRYCEKIEAMRYPSVHLANKLPKLKAELAEMHHVLAVAKGKKDPDSVDRDCPSCWC